MERLKSVAHFIEATSFEQHAIWKKHHESTDWEPDSSGLLKKIGYVNGDENMPISVTFMFAKIFGQLICFYEATSRFVDHDEVESWIRNKYAKKYDNNSRTAMTNANNFHHVIQHCEELSKKSTVTF